MGEMMSEDRKLFKIYVPWHVRIWGSVRSWLRNRTIIAAAKAEKKRYKNVATVKQITNWSDTGGKDYEYYSLWEDGFGHRRFEYRSSNWLLDKPKATKVYNHVVEPWLTGRVSTPFVQKFEENQLNRAS